MKISSPDQLDNRVKALRLQRGWSQEELAAHAGMSRPAVSAIELQRLVPSVAVALALAQVFDCRVEDVFVGSAPNRDDAAWAWPPTSDPCRYWHARIGDKTVLYPVEPSVTGLFARDGVLRSGVTCLSGAIRPEQTLVMATCDPAVGLLADELARTSDFRLLVFQRASRPALDLLRQGLIHVAGVHLAVANRPDANIDAARSALGPGHSILTVANWQEGLALGASVAASTVASVLRSRLRWVGREAGSGARQCQDEVLQHRPLPRRMAKDHRGVAAAIRCGWADAGICVRLVSEEVSLKFIGVREESYQLCFPDALEDDPRMRALLQVIRSRSYRSLLAELPGYDCRNIGENARV
jgi:molybdate-binding protein/DNA-binding XRE family transcriptional regulator